MYSIRKMAAYAVLMCFLFSCNQKDDTDTDQATKDSSLTPVPAISRPDDSVTAKLRNALVRMELTDLQLSGNTVSRLDVSEVQYRLISFKAYYEEQKQSLSGSAGLSKNQEKTKKALAYLDKMIAGSDNDPVIYRVEFHLTARAGEFDYDQRKTAWLKMDLSKLQVIYPD